MAGHLSGETAEAVYVLHAFEEKTRKTPKQPSMLRVAGSSCY